MAIGDPLSLTVVANLLTGQSGQTVPYAGIAVAIQFAGMAVSDAATSTTFDPSSLVINVSDPGYDTSGNVTTVYRTIHGTLPTRQPFPLPWVSGTVFAAKRRTQTGNNYYITPTGGTSTVAPSGTTVGASVTGSDSVTWTCIGTLNNTGFFGSPAPYGVMDAASGSDAIVYAIIDDYIFAGTTIISATIGAGAYQTVGPNASSNALVSIPTLANPSTLAYPPPIVDTGLTLPHLACTSGSYDAELIVGSIFARNGQPVPFVKTIAWDFARTTSATSTTNALVKSNQVTTASPGGTAIEVYRTTTNVSGLPASTPTTPAFVEHEIYPWIGTRVYRTRYDGDGADWQAVAYPFLNTVIRSAGKLYFLSTVGTGAAVTAPTQASGASTADANGYVWTFYGSGLTTICGANPQARHHFNNDPANTYRRGHAMVDPSGANVGTPQVWDTRAQAQASPNRFGTVQLAEAAMATYNASVVGGTGGTTTHADVGGGTVYLAAGTHTTLGAAMSGVAAADEWFNVVADPAAAAGAVILNLASALSVPKRTRIGTGITVTAFQLSQADNSYSMKQASTEIVVDGMSGSGNGTVLYSTGIQLYRNSTLTNVSLIGANNQSLPTSIFGCNIVGATRAANVSGTKMLANGAGCITDGQTSYTPPKQFFVGVSNFITGGAGKIPVAIQSGTAGYNRSTLGGMWHNNVVEYTDTFGGKCVVIAGDNSQGISTNWCVTNNTHMGERDNQFYNDFEATSGLCTLMLIANNSLWGQNSIDDYYDHNVTAVPTHRDGRRSGNMAVMYAIGKFQNRIYTGANSFGLDNSTGMRNGRGSIGPIVGPWQASYSAEFVRDASFTGTGAGGGDWHPTASSSGRLAVVQVSKFAQDGALRYQNGTGFVGALEGPALAFRSRRAGLLGASAGVSV